MSTYTKNKRPQIYVYQRIYEQHYGPVPREPDGTSYDIHHIDGDPFNNDPSNLVALTHRDHAKLHATRRPSQIGRKLPDETRAKMASSKKGYRPAAAGRRGSENNRARKVRCIQTGKVYGSLVECATELNLTVKTIQNWCKREAKTTHNNHWNGLSFEYVLH